MHSIKLAECRIGIKFDKDPLAAEQNNYLSKIVNVYIAYELDAWPRNPTNNFKFKNCLSNPIQLSYGECMAYCKDLPFLDNTC